MARDNQSREQKKSLRPQAIGLSFLTLAATAAGIYLPFYVVIPPEYYLHYHIGFVLVLAVAAFTATGLLLKLHRRLNNFESLAQKIIRSNYSERIDPRSLGEFHNTARIFNHLAEQLHESMDTRQSLAEFDNLILSGADITAIIRRCLIAASMDAINIRMYMRSDQTELIVHQLNGMRVTTKQIPIFDMAKEAWQEADFYRQIAERETGQVLESYPIACDDNFVGALTADGHRTLTAPESKRLADLVDRLSVALTNIKHSETLYEQANFDALTGLLNRRAFEERLKETLARASRGEQGSLLFLDLDGFKKVNDTSGHEAGDQLLIKIAERLRTAVRPSDTIARLGGDEFALIAPDCTDEHDINTLCGRIVEEITSPIHLGRTEHMVGTSIGVARFPEDSNDVDELMMKADSAMYKAKNEGGSRFAFFDDNLMAATNHRNLVESRLRNAVKEHLLELHFQPKVNLRTWRIDSVEALLRWSDSELGNVSPTEFIGVAEESNIIHDIMPILIDGSTNLLNQADCSDLPLATVAINASNKQIMTEGFALSVLSQLDARGMRHDRVEIEVTETIFAEDMARVLSELHILRMAGIRIALDDFGTGYSSLNMLRELPLDMVKIDRAFITEIEGSEQARSMLKHLIDISNSLGLQVIAEGVETDAQLQFLIENECDYAQGWLIAKALPEQELLTTLADWQTKEAAKQPQLKVV